MARPPDRWLLNSIDYIPTYCLPVFGVFLYFTRTALADHSNCSGRPLHELRRLPDRMQDPGTQEEKDHWNEWQRLGQVGWLNCI